MCDSIDLRLPLLRQEFFLAVKGCSLTAGHHSHHKCISNPRPLFQKIPDTKEPNIVLSFKLSLLFIRICLSPISSNQPPSSERPSSPPFPASGKSSQGLMGRTQLINHFILFIHVWNLNYIVPGFSRQHRVNKGFHRYGY